eukprot:1731998-Ditylum_brightwellii.AAC.1
MHNIAAPKKLEWKSPMEVSEGHTQDISEFRFHIWEPVWYYKKYKAPNINHGKRQGGWDFSTTHWDNMTYYIKTEEKKLQYLIHSIVCSHQKRPRTNWEYLNDGASQQEEPKAIELHFINQYDDLIENGA